MDGFGAFFYLFFSSNQASAGFVVVRETRQREDRHRERERGREGVREEGHGMLESSGREGLEVCSRRSWSTSLVWYAGRGPWKRGGCAGEGRWMS